MQFFCLSVLTGVYFAGLLLKTQAMALDSGIGVLLVTTLVTVVVAAFALAITEFRTGPHRGQDAKEREGRYPNAFVGQLFFNCFCWTCFYQFLDNNLY
jgi:hypothetical protein